MRSSSISPKCTSHLGIGLGEPGSALPNMTPRLLKGLNPQSLFVAVFLVALTVAALALLLQPSGRVESQEERPLEDLPVVSLESVSPTRVAEGKSLKVMLGISEVLEEEDGSLCSQETSLACVEGGIWIFDSYNNEENDEDLFRVADELIAFVFRDETFIEVSHTVHDDNCLTNGGKRKIWVAINPSFNAKKYGYKIKGYVYDDEGYAIRNGELPTLPPVEVTDTDPECGVKGISVGDTMLELEEGESTSYDVTLDAEPDADVTITITAGDGILFSNSCDHAEIDNNKELTFTTGNWNQEQTVSIWACADPDGVDDTVTITHKVMGSGHGYEDVSIPKVMVTVIDNDVPPNTPTFTPTPTNTPTPTQSNSPARGEPTISGTRRVGERG